MDWSDVDYLWIIVMFLSAVWTLILTAPIHCTGSIGEQVMQCYIYPNLMKKQTHLHLGWPEDEYIFSKFSFLGELFFNVSFLTQYLIKMPKNYYFPTKLDLKCNFWYDSCKLNMQRHEIMWHQCSIRLFARLFFCILCSMCHIHIFKIQ